MTHAPLASSPHLWQINHCITSSVQPSKLSRRQPEEGLTVAWRKPNVSSDVRPDHFGPNRNPPLMVRQPFDMSSEALAKEEAQRGLPRLSVVGRPVGTTVHSLQSLGEAGSVVRLKDPGLKSERIKITMKFYHQTDISHFRHLPISNLTKFFSII